MIAYASSLDQGGPMARSAEDCALLLNAMAGFDERDSTSLERDKEDYTRELVATPVDKPCRASESVCRKSFLVRVNDPVAPQKSCRLSKRRLPTMSSWGANCRYQPAEREAFGGGVLRDCASRSKFKSFRLTGSLRYRAPGVQTI